MFVMPLHMGIESPYLASNGASLAKHLQSYLSMHTDLVLILGRLSAACRASRQEHQEQQDSLAGPSRR